MPQFIAFLRVHLGIAAVGCNHIEMQIRIRSYLDFWSLNTGPLRDFCVFIRVLVFCILCHDGRN